jgi:hypothetical protein
MNIDTSIINQTQQTQTKSQSATAQTQQESSTNFADELNNLNKESVEESSATEETTAEQDNSATEENLNIENEQNIENENNGDAVSEEESLNKSLEELNMVVQEFNRSDEKEDVSLKSNKKEDDNRDEGDDVINNDFSIQDNKDILPQMGTNMNFSGDGQPFSSFMNDENSNNSKLSSSAKDLAEESAILSTMAENIAMANRQQIESNEQNNKEKTVSNEEGVKIVDTTTNTTIETVISYDSVIMTQADVEVFSDLVNNGVVDLNNITPESAEQATQISKTLADMLAKAKENNQPVRIDFDNNISVIIRISGDGKIRADFLPSNQIAETYLKENLPLLKQRFEENNLEYDSLNRRERKDQDKENNRKKGRDNE